MIYLYYLYLTQNYLKLVTSINTNHYIKKDITKLEMKTTTK